MYLWKGLPIDQEIYLVGFKAEYNIKDDELIDRAFKRMNETGMDLIVANDVSIEGKGFLCRKILQRIS